MHTTGRIDHIEDIAWDLSDCLMRVNSSANIMTHAMILVEMSIVDQVIYAYFASEKNALVIEEGSRLIDDIIMSDDKLYTLEARWLYLLSKYPEWDLTKWLEEIINAIDQKAAMIKRKERTRMALNLLFEVTNKNQSKNTLADLANLMIDVMNQGSPSDEFDQQVSQLKQFFNKKQSTKI